MTAKPHARRASLIRTSLPWAIDCLSSFEKIKNLGEGDAAIDQFLAILGALARLDELFLNSIYAQHLKVSSQHATSFRTALDKAREQMTDKIVALNSGQIATVRYQASQFWTVLMSEFGVIPTFMVSAKGSYDVALLADSGHRLFPPSTLLKAPETEKDMAEAGRALAFELSTACGFHTFRVLESVIKRYWDHVAQQKRPALETIGNYAQELSKGKHGDQKVWETLGQIGKLHRNPLIHPEVILSVDEAIGILGIVNSAISAMLTVMPDVPTSTVIPSGP